LPLCHIANIFCINLKKPDSLNCKKPIKASSAQKCLAFFFVRPNWYSARIAQDTGRYKGGHPNFAKQKFRDIFEKISRNLPKFRGAKFAKYGNLVF